jgi:hypothetical protein
VWLAAAASAGPQPVRLEADAVTTPFGPTIRFIEAGPGSNANAPTVHSIRIIRPAGVGVAAPPRGKTLGGLNFFVGPNTCPTCPDRRSLRLGRRRALGGGSYLLASGYGVRVVLSTSQRSRFLRVSLPNRARNVQVTLTRTGARLLRFPGCQTARFAARFELSTGGATDGDVISGGRLRRAGLC